MNFQNWIYKSYWEESCWLDSWSIHLWIKAEVPWTGTWEAGPDCWKWVSNILIFVCFSVDSITYCNFCRAMAKTTVKNNIWPWERALYCYPSAQIIVFLLDKELCISLLLYNRWCWILGNFYFSFLWWLLSHFAV